MRWILGVVVVVGCGSSHGGDPDATGGIDTGTSDTGCAGNQTLCDGICVDEMSDPMHCGSCPTTCSGQTSSCAGGTCHVPHETTWVVHYGGPDFGYFVDAVAVDAAGNVYIAGSMLGTI